MQHEYAYPEFTNSNDSDERDHNCLEPEDSYAAIFWETVHKMKEDADWLTAQPRKESDLLYRYFGSCVSRMKDLPDYRTVMDDCLDYLKHLEVQVVERIPVFGLPDSVMEATPMDLFLDSAFAILKASNPWLCEQPRTTPEIVQHLFEEEWGIEEQRVDLQLTIAACLMDLGYRTQSHSDSEVTWKWFPRKALV
ncbi:hypothetical protein [Geothrix sp.]|jgi:hypothetical protein|uniref:hypothetical protein n=1 Tax=Geothrix sp. TaxID=1962974 RepID=UPI0025B9D3B4|nr:hypothetical protein [Geothrix sp.]